MIGRRRRAHTRPGRWISSTTTWRRDRSCPCSPSWICSLGSRLSSTRGSAIAVKTLWRRSNGSAQKSAIPLDPRRSALRVHLARSRSVGVSEQRHAWLQLARRADGQRVHQGVQRSIARQVPQHALAPDDRRRQGEAGALAEALQRGKTTRRHREPSPDNAARSAGRNQPG